MSKELRSLAEDMVRLTRRDVALLAGQDIQHIVHELQVHQVELEMQNETLRASQRSSEEAQARYQELFDTAPVGYIIVGTDGRATQANEAATLLLHSSQSSLIGQRMHAFFVREDRSSLDHQLQLAMREARTRCDVRLTVPDEPVRHLRVDISVIPSTGDKCLLALTDITDAKRSLEAMERLNRELEARVAARTAELATRNLELEEQMAATTKHESEQRRLEARLRQAERHESLGVLAGGIAHDFNNLLVGVLGNAELLLLSVDISDAWRESLMMIKRAARQAADLTRQLLAFAGQGHLSMTALNLPNVVTECLELLRVRLPPNIQLQARVTTAVPEIQADRGQVNQVVMNLVINAFEALDGPGASGGVIAVQTHTERLDHEALTDYQHHSTAQPGQFVILHVRDSGPGLSAATIARVFEPFYSTKFAGRGLGLASVLGIVQSHHGALRVASELGVGTSFDIAFPVAESLQDSDRPPVLLELPWKGSGSVLLIDDDASVRRVVTQLLVTIGFNVTAADGGEAGLHMFRSAETRFKLVVLDWMMPGFSGEQTLRALRVEEAELPIILISGYSAQDLSAYDSRVVCVQKPMTLAQLRKSIRQLIDVTAHHATDG
ncbi:MAG: hypothetical protein RL701_7792 [Pseudomonadota bacterium]